MSETEKFDVPEVLAALEAAVAEKGADYVYVNENGEVAGGIETIGCTYTHHAKTDHAEPGCIVGQAYFTLTGELVPAHQNSAVILDPYGSPREVFTSEAVDLLSAVQVLQDGGEPWGEALATARKKLGV